LEYTIIASKPANIFAITTQGLEVICAAELKLIPGVNRVTSAYRRVSATFDGDLNELLKLRSIDDIFIDLATWHGIVKQRSALEDIQYRSSQLNFQNAINLAATIRAINSIPSFSVTANFIGKRNYSYKEIKDAVSVGIRSKQSWNYQEDDRLSEINVRVFLEHETAYVGIRLGRQPLQNREYKHSHILGSLKPPVAAAMLLLLPEKEGTIFDPFCGAGTILLESRCLGFNAAGGDYDKDALCAARENAASAKISLNLVKWDANKLPLTDHSIKYIVTNLPWGRQVEVEHDISQKYKSFCTELSRVLDKDGTAIFLTTLPDFIQIKNFRADLSQEISVFGQRPTLVRISPMQSG